MKTTIYMIRHAESPFVFGQERTRTLSLQGEIDTKKVTNLMKDKKVDVIVTSPYIRAIQTIEGVANDKKINIKVFEELKERQLKGAFKLQEEQIRQAIKTSFENIDFQLVGGESVSDVQSRAIPVIKNLLNNHKGKSIVIGTHGNIMTIIMNYFNNEYGYDFWVSTSKPDIYKLSFSGEVLQSVQRIWN